MKQNIVVWDFKKNSLENKKMLFNEVQEVLGWIPEMIRVGENLYILVNEDGRRLESDNTSMIFLKDQLGEEQKKIIFGNIVFVKKSFNGELLSTTKKDLKGIFVKKVFQLGKDLYEVA